MTARDRSILIGLGVLAVLAGFWFTVLAPKRAEVTGLEGQIATQQQRLQTAQAIAAEAADARARYEDDYAAVVRLGKAMPSDDGLASLLYQLETAADGAKVDFRSIQRAGTNPGAAAAPAPGASAGTSTGTATSGTSSAQAAGTTGASATASASLPPGATVGTAGLATLPFSLTFRGSYFELESFLRNVQNFVTMRDGELSVRGRLLTVDGLSLVPSGEGLKNIEATVSATAYLQPADAAAAATADGGTTPDTGATAGTTAAPTQTASATSSGAQ